MSDERPVSGRVLDVISPTELVIDAGREHGVVEGMKFEILADDQEIYLNGEVIARVVRVKVRVRARLVFSSFSVCETYERRAGFGLGYSSVLAGSAALGPSSHRISLRSDDLPYRTLSLESSYLDRGDRAVELTDSESADVVVIDVADDGSDADERPLPALEGRTEEEADAEAEAPAEERVVDKEALERYTQSP